MPPDLLEKTLKKILDEPMYRPVFVDDPSLCPVFGYEPLHVLIDARNHLGHVSAMRRVKSDRVFNRWMNLIFPNALHLPEYN